MLSNERNTLSRSASRLVMEAKAATVIYAGALVVNDGGKAAPGKTAAGLVALGRAAETVDNTNGGKSVEIDKGTFRYGNSGADPVTAASIGKQVYIVDDETVAATSDTNARSVAGVCFDLDDNGVWVTFA